MNSISSGPARATPAEIILWLLIAAQYVVLLAPTFALTVGDGFIVMRYAENLVEHGELSFNVAERIWSFTSPLHALLAAAYYALTGDSLLTNKLISVLCVVGSVALLARGICESGLERLLAAVFLLLAPCLMLWTTAGLETAHLTLLIALLVVLTWRSRSIRVGPRHVAAVCCVSALAFLCRYDAVLFLVPVVLFAFRRSGISAATVAAALPGAVMVVSWMAFSYGYYHDIFPTSFYFKRPSVESGELLRNLVYEIQFVLIFALPVVVALWRAQDGRLSDAGAVRRDTRVRPLQHVRADWWLWTGLALIALYGLTAGTKHMMFSYRLFLPYLPAVFCAGLIVSRRLPPPQRSPSRSSGRSTGLHMACLPVMAFQALVWGYVYFYSVNPSLVSEFRTTSAQRMIRYSNEVWDPLAGELRRHWLTHPGHGTRSPTIFISEAGQIPYRLKVLYVFDPGLISWRHRCRYDLTESADYVVIGSWSSSPPVQPTYELVARRPIPANGGEGFDPGQFLALYVNKSPGPNRLPRFVDQPC